ncbi:Ubiquitin-like modifier-activating enzyme ATG7, partial [Stegodyphus mimosarum]
MSTNKLLQFAPFSSAIETGFWYQLTKMKLEIFKLDDAPVNIRGFYSNCCSSGLPPIANIDYSSFYEDVQMPSFSFPLKGILINTNTLEDFKIRDKKVLLHSLGCKVWDAIKNGAALEDPSVLQLLLCLTFADLKKYRYYYWIAFPALTFPEVIRSDETKKLHEYLTADQLNQFLNSYDDLSVSNKMGFLVFIDEEGKCHAHKFSDYNKLKMLQGKILIGFADPCTYDKYPGWPLRNVLSLVAYSWGKYQNTWDVICLREFVKEGKRHCEHSIVLTVQLVSPDIPVECPDVVGWEKNQNKLAPKMVDMSSNMDPAKLADAAVDLNLKLMRWRLLPELQLEAIKAARCLLFGAGTLGCNVARCLLGWGVRKITFVDNSRVSYSNPVRQTLYTFEDSLQGGKYKAVTAAESLKNIFPGVDAQGLILSVPMPGHSIPENLVDNIRSDVKQIEELIDSHDVIFLLMDTRESRWLPSLIGASKGKIVLNAALGFDTFLIMRHGMKKFETGACGDDFCPKIIEGGDLGCYFCNDIVAPGNSTHDRTLDQQCTVTRPGVSFMAAALVVELMVSIFQHPKRALAPASTSASSDTSCDELTTDLGIVPHQIRGHIDKFQNAVLTSKAFDRCTACSDKVLQMYEKNGFDFLLKVFCDPNYLEEITGLAELMNSINMEDVFELSDDDGSI